MEKVKQSVAVVLDRKEMIWECNICKKQYKQIPGQCSCGALGREFDEVEAKTTALEEREDYVVEKNIIYNGRQVNKGRIVNLSKVDRVTKSMVKEGLITPVKKVKEEK